MYLKADRVALADRKTKRYILSQTSLEVQAGEFLVVTGNSGSGKSTLLAILGGLLTPSEGEVTFREANVYRMTGTEKQEYYQKVIGYVPQSNVMLKKYNLLENLILPYQLQDKSVPGEKLLENAKRHLYHLGLEGYADRYPYELSGGELKRAALARAMLKEPEILIADEPTTGLDAGNRTALLNYLEAYNKTGKTVILASHEEQAVQYGTRIIKLERL